MSYTRGSIRFSLLFCHPFDRPFGDGCGATVMHQPPKRGLLGPMACGLAAAVIVVYLPALWCDFIYDDFLVVHARSVPSGFSDVVSVFTTRQADNLPYYRPLTWLTIDLQNAAHGQSATAFHAFNVLLASCWALSVFWLLLSPSMRLTWSAALVGALMAAVHPVSACAIYPVSSGRETLLAAVAITAAVAAWLRANGPGGRRWAGVAWGLVGMGLLCREQAVVLPVLFVWADLLGMSGARPSSLIAWLRRHAAGVVLLGVYLAIRWSLFAGSGEHHLAVLDNPLGPLQSIGYTLQSLVAPGWSLVYEPGVADWWSPPRGLLSMAILGGIGLGVWRGRSGSDGQRGRVVLFWIGWFLLVIAPTASLVQQQTPFAERYGFLATVPLVALVLMALEKLPVGRGRRGLGAALVIVIGLAVVGWARGTAYRSHRGFLEQWVRAVPTSAQAHLSLAGVLLEDGNDPVAERHLDRALQLQPGYSEAHDGKGRVLFHRGELAAAEKSFRRAIDAKPSYAVAWNHLGFVIEQQGKLDEAAEACGRAVELDPQLVEARNNLGMILAQQGRFDQARGHLERAVQLEPGYAEAWTNLGLVYLDQGRSDKAADAWRGALKADPDFTAARLNLERLERAPAGGGGR
ncbi:MAG TPA: hypothetical protein DCE47_11810 [Planctomycetaceae bacterium]|nr:hypothetical protein [Planctomycetaceae bacterium]HCC99317.1 hypothetical protein [Planctomycetaceae bacterium]